VSSAGRRGAGADRPRQQILAMGGGGFTMGEVSPALDRHVLALTGKPLPKICFLPTASGDASEQLIRFHERFDSWPCQPSSLSLFHLAAERIDPVSHLLAQDAIYVGGGSMRNMLAIWREHGIDVAMRRAWNAGVLLAGLSAGAMCWFQAGVSSSGGRPGIVSGLGLLPGSLSVHRDGEPERMPVFCGAVARGSLPPGYAADDGAALVYRGTRLAECVASRPGAGVVRVAPDGAGGVVEEALAVRLLPGAAGDDAGRGRGSVAAADAHGVSELRELRAGRARWD
jgi:peptidase E